jgi:hypothetical protein
MQVDNRCKNTCYYSAMPSRIPHLQLTHGQVAWAINHGQEPSPRLLHQLRHLRLLDIPFTQEEQNNGRGNPMRYGFDELIECGVALEAIGQGMKAIDVAGMLLKDRARMRKLYRETYHAQPDGALTASWVKSRGRIHVMQAEPVYLKMHDRYSDTPGAVEPLQVNEALAAGRSPGDMVERYPDGSSRYWIPLSRLVLELVAWAQDAPVKKAGRPGLAKEAGVE